jgi:predicted NAD-dependent protein-ADP-ribosyltransferase YbiA (DUF1768 family)
MIEPTKPVIAKHDDIRIRKVKEPFGCLGNMSPHRVTALGATWLTAEALFQAGRFAFWHPWAGKVTTTENEFDDIFEHNVGIAREILAQKSPMAAKMVAQKHINRRIVLTQTEQDLKLMRWVLKLKTDQVAEIKHLLRATDDRFIVEDVTNRPGDHSFWGARELAGHWVGFNWLGHLWMELRG